MRERVETGLIRGGNSIQVAERAYFLVLREGEEMKKIERASKTLLVIIASFLIHYLLQPAGKPSPPNVEQKNNSQSIILYRSQLKLVKKDFVPQTELGFIRNTVLPWHGLQVGITDHASSTISAKFRQAMFHSSRYSLLKPPTLSSKHAIPRLLCACTRVSILMVVFYPVTLQIAARMIRYIKPSRSGLIQAKSSLQ